MTSSKTASIRIINQGPASMTTNRSKQGSKSSSHPNLCIECVRIDKSRDQDPSRARYCERHQCPVNLAPGITCSTRKKGADKRCTMHFVPRCNMEGCSLDCFEKSIHCELHSCTVRGCHNDARPGKGRDYCEEHECADRDCDLVRKRRESHGTLIMANFCKFHECQTKGCDKKKYPEKSYCVLHCCNARNCPEARQGDPLGPMCLDHYNERISSEAIARVRAAEIQARAKADHDAQVASEVRAQREAQEKAAKRRSAELEAQARAAQIQRDLQRETEVSSQAQTFARNQRIEAERLQRLDEESRIFAQKQEVEYLRRQEAERLRRQRSDRYSDSTRSSSSSERSRFFEQPKLRREDAYYEYDYDNDEAYNSSSSTSAEAGDGHLRDRFERTRIDGIGEHKLRRGDQMKKDVWGNTKGW